MEIYTMRADGSDVHRLTNRPGPDGGPFFSYDGRQIAYRGHPLQPGAEYDDYLALLKQHLWRPTKLEISVMDRDGRNDRRLTSLGAASFAPSPVVALNRAAAIGMAEGPAAALPMIERLAAEGEMDNYHLLHAARGDLLRRLNLTADAARAFERARDLATNEQERRFLEKRRREIVSAPKI
jgi:hypothetical protein